ncbi:putative carboxylesterase 18 [Iris pallida]|uniref:Carboxylesterase 18 n=1 Tax=Iris pallida TaxID=29817 RepID=A0AAX6GEI6_IRIPA|nr:putative carboxylesterase 18 [Iris pallida]
MPHLITWTRASKKIRVGIGQPAPAMSLLHQTTHLAGANAVRFRRSCRVKAELAHGTSTTTLQDPPRQPQPPSFPLPAKIFYSLINLVLCFAKRRDGTLNRRCISFLDAVRSPPDPDGGPDGVATSDHVVDPERNLSVRYYSPPPAEEIRDGQVALPVVVYFHGGGFVTGSTAAPQFDGFCRRLSKQLPARVVSVDYRLAPGHRYPAPCDDGVAVLRWLDGGSGLFIDDLSAVFLAGDSAGDNIAHHVARRAAAEERYERTRVLGLVAIQPFFGGEEDTESERRLPFVSRRNLKWLWRIYLPEGSDSDHEAANVFGPGSSTSSSWSKGEWTHFPATMVVVGGLDSLQDRQRWYYEGLKRMGVEAYLVEYPNAIHSFHVLPGNADAQQLVRDVADFVRRKCEEAVWTRRSLGGWKWTPEVWKSNGFFDQ